MFYKVLVLKNSIVFSDVMKPPNGIDVASVVDVKAKSVNQTETVDNDTKQISFQCADRSASTKRPTVRFPDDVASQILALGPGNFLSRSQDNLSGPTGTAGKRKGSIPSSSSKRPQSSLGIPKSNTNGVTLSKAAPRTMSSAQLTRKANSPVAEKSTASKEFKHPDAVLKSNKKHVYASQQVADARINRTKLTVTELQKQKQELEMHVSELVKKAESKQAELATMKMEIRRLKEERSEELQRLSNENDILKQKLRLQSRLNGSNCGSLDNLSSSDVNGKMYVDAGTSPLLIAKPFNSDEGGTDSDDVLLPGTGASSNRAAAEWDRQSTSSEISVACLQDRIVQMEETHYSTNEELQATLQELTDLQDIVNDLTKENQNLSEEKTLLYNSLCKQSEKVDNCRLQIENLKHLLLSGTDMRLNRVSSSLSTCGADGKPSEREQKLIDLLKSTHDEHEELLCKFDDIRSAFKTSDEEKREQQEMLEILKDRARLLEAQLEHANAGRKNLEENLYECKQQLDKDKREIMRVTNAYEKERCRVEELLRHSNATDKDEMKKLLDLVRADKDSAEDRVNTLEEALTAKNVELDKLSNVVRNLETELKYLREDNEKNELASEEKSRELERDNEILNQQSIELKNALMDLNERCQRQADDKKEYKANILTLQKTVDDLTIEKERIRKELGDLLHAKEQEADEWRQFQSDLQVAVVVANDFKMEAQEDIERLTAENSQLREKLTNLSQEVEKIRNIRMSPTKVRVNNNNSSAVPLPMPIPNPPVPSSPDIKSRMEGYLSSVERAANQKSPPSFTIATPPSIRPPKNVESNNNSNNKCVLSVRALVESLENAGGHPSSVSFRLPPSSMRSPGASRHPGSSSNHKSNGAADSDVLSKSSSHLASRPISLEGVELLVKPQLKAAISEGEVQSLTPVFRGSPQKALPNASASSDGGACYNNYDGENDNRQPRGILRNQQPSRKLSYL